MDVCIIEIKNTAHSASEIAKIGADPYSVPIMAPKAAGSAIRLSGIDNRAANLLKQFALSAGADAAVNKDVCRFIRGSSDALLMANRRQLDTILKKLLSQPFGLAGISEKIAIALSNYQKNSFDIRYGRKILKIRKRPLVMGVLNVTPDSFSDKGLFLRPEDAVECALVMADEGADIIDIGGESSRPGSAGVSLKEEKQRVLAVIRKAAKKIKIPISIDTTKSEVALAAIENGASIINDISAFRSEKGRMAKVAAKFRVPVILMHMQGMPKTMQQNPAYREVVSEIRDFLSERIQFALGSGVAADKIMIDPGIGFGKTLQHNIEILRRLKEFKVLGFPIVVGASRKAFIGKLLNMDEPSERLSGTLGAGVWSALNGASVLRVHDVKETVEALKIVEALQ